MKSLDSNIISNNASGREAIIQLDRAKIGSKALFIVDENGKLLGTLTDGDIRRGLIAGKDIDASVENFINRNFRYLYESQLTLSDLNALREIKIVLVPVLDQSKKLIKILDLNDRKAILPVDAIIMAGGRGERLKPLTDAVPKPMLKVGDKPIIEHNLDRLIYFGIENITISIKYLGEQLKAAFGNGEEKGIHIQYITEEQPLGTIGAVSMIDGFKNDHVLIMNSDLLTNIDFEDFFQTYQEQNADIAIATVPYKVDIPYAVLEVENSRIKDFKEKPSYTYYSNAGIYLIKREFLRLIPKGAHYNATDLMELLLKNGHNVVSYPILGYWLDIGKHEDFLKAQVDIKHIQF
ncbi:nucleotidyltransferase family protein [Adhaeribacter sp. BT258]|uniref:Nucleotidyltransferase family protein n=1 Tax=Adhaeribacter terrigena TaxID=2793070 RepID=A0ABS1BXT2_9BACT|nr:nucleotidyltransferase family protein [Adhaeribacter terrigena]MBK0401707.1 nucleotidyltransferase family protein [Adhaeribacter terrigena]